MASVTPFLMFRGPLDAAIELYTDLFPDAETRVVTRAGWNGPIQSAELVIGGQLLEAFNGAPRFVFSEGFSLFVGCRDQDEVDRLWNKLADAGGTTRAVRLDHGSLRPVLAQF